MTEWNIQSRGHACEACGAPFADKQPYHTLLFDDKAVLRRSDICPTCWEKQYSDGAQDRKGFISHWQGIYEAPPPPGAEPIQKETAEGLLRKLIELNDPRYAPAGYILAVMLERKRLLKVKEEVVRDGKRVFLYEQPKTGDVFTIIDPDLQLNQLEAVQHDVATLLEHGLTPPAAAEAPAATPPAEAAPPADVPAPAEPAPAPAPAPPRGERISNAYRLNAYGLAATLPLSGRDSAAHGVVRRCGQCPPGYLLSTLDHPLPPTVSDFADLQARLGYSFREPELLKLALTHPSVAHEKGAPVQTNQRLEFLGDAVLQLVLTRELYEKFPKVGEGPLTKARAKLVNRRTLADHAHELGLGACLLLSRGEELHGGRERPSSLADTFEALMGAIFLDGGFEAAREFILHRFAAAFSELPVIPILENPKGELQELLQSTSSEAPHYYILSASGPDHDRVFECTVHHRGIELARGAGKSKKAAESAAALAALTHLRHQRDAQAAAAAATSPAEPANPEPPPPADP